MKKNNKMEDEIKIFLQERNSPNHNIISPEEIAESIYFLTTETASQINGFSLSHDNGNSID